MSADTSRYLEVGRTWSSRGGYDVRRLVEVLPPRNGRGARVWYHRPDRNPGQSRGRYMTLPSWIAWCKKAEPA